MQAQACRQQAFQTNGAIGGFGKGQTFGVNVVRVMIRANDINLAGTDAFNHGETIIFDLLGDLYLIPIAGGEAIRLTEGAAYDLLATDLLGWLFSGASRESLTTIDCTMAQTRKIMPKSVAVTPRPPIDLASVA